MKMSTIILIGMITIAIPELLMDIFGKGNSLANFLYYIIGLGVIILIIGIIVGILNRSKKKNK